MNLTKRKTAFIIVLLLLFPLVNAYGTNEIKQTEAVVNEEQPSTDLRRKIRLGFTAPSTIHRQLLLTEDTNASSGIDWGYDSEYLATVYEDMYWIIDDQLFIIQGTDSIDENSSFPLGFHIHSDGMSTIGLDALENIASDVDLFLYDSELEFYHDLRTGDYEFYAEAGEYLDRFALVFTLPQASSDVLSIGENELDKFKLYYDHYDHKLTLSNLSGVSLKHLTVYNLAGQSIHVQHLNEATSKVNVHFNQQPAQGTYIVHIETYNGTVSKKVLLH